MPEQLTWFVGNRNPSINENLVDRAGAAVDLTGKTVKFMAREVGSSTLLVNQDAEIVNPPGVNGLVRYNWSTDDIDPAFNGGEGGALSKARQLLEWWRVTTTSGGRTQDYNEAIITVAAHAPAGYVELEELKATAELSGTTFADQDIRLAIAAASRGIDQALGQRFYADANALQERLYTANGEKTLRIDPLLTLTSLATDPDDDGDFDYTWTRDTDFVLEPVNAPADGRPWNTIRILSAGRYAWPSYPNRIKLTGKFGWAAPPVAIKQLTTIIATRLVKRTREAPFGIIGLGMDAAVVRAAAIARDPEYAFLTQGLSRRRLFV